MLVFVGLFDKRKATQVADDLGMTQPSISHALARLRDIFDDELFVRNAHGMEPTHRASALEPQIREILFDTNRLLERGHQIKPEDLDGDFTIAATDLEFSLFLPKIIDGLAKWAPKLRIRTVLADRLRSLELLNSYKADMAMGYFPIAPSRILTSEILTSGYSIVAARKHNFWQTKGDMDAYLNEQHLLVSPSGEGRGIVDVRLEELAKARNLALTVPNFMMAFHVLRQGNVIATLPTELSQHFADQFDLKLAPSVVELRNLHISIAISSRNAGDIVIQKISEILGASLP